MPSFRKAGKYTLRIVPSGYEFLGPGNEISYNVPRNYNDVVAKYHDIAYKALQDKGVNPYITLSRADRAFLSDLQPNDFPSYAAKYIFKTKSFIAQAGLINTGMSFPNSPWVAFVLAKTTKAQIGKMPS